MIMKDLLNIRELINIESLESEYELEKASLLERKLRLLMKDDPDLKPFRNKLRELIVEYEERVWSQYNDISDSQLVESDKAEEIVNFEQIFIQKRKDSIRKKLKEFDMTQQDLGVLLGHPKSYMSELMNGVSQFTLKDLVIIHKVLGLSLNILIPTFLQSETRSKVRESIVKLNKPKLRKRESALLE
jgi:plasmid maintenance system antidote protein VapI